MSDHITSINVSINALDCGSNELGEAFGDYLRGALQSEYPEAEIEVDVELNCSGYSSDPVVLAGNEEVDVLGLMSVKSDITKAWDVFIETEAHKYGVC